MKTTRVGVMITLIIRGEGGIIVSKAMATITTALIREINKNYMKKVNKEIKLKMV